MEKEKKTEIKIEKTDSFIKWILIFIMFQAFMYIGEPDIHDAILTYITSLI